MINKHNLLSKKQLLAIGLLGVLHFLCDLICGYKIVGVFGHQHLEYALAIYLIYNILAFAFQPLLGFLVDKYHNEKVLILVSVGFLVLGFLLPIWYLSAVCLGIANQLFHIAGGKLCTNMTTEKAYPLGIFVSLGAIGLTIGSLFYTASLLGIIAISLYLILSIVCYLLVPRYISSVQPKEKKAPSVIAIGIVFLSIVVFIRSFMGTIIHYDFAKTLTFTIFLALGATLGKGIGGFLRDAFGSLKVIIASTVIGCICFLFFANSPTLIIIGIISLNISMPITLYELNILNKGHEAFNFGLLAAILFVGVTVGLLYQYTLVTYIIIVIIAGILTIVSIMDVQKRNKDG